MSNRRGPVVVRRRLGATLKQLREDKGYHLAAVARQLEFSASKLSRLETGQIAPKIRDVRDLLEMYEASEDLRAKAMQWAEDAKGLGWWQPYSASMTGDLDLYLSLESEARGVKVFSTVIPGLLQTQDYARALLSSAEPQSSASLLEELVAIRMGRQRILRSDELSEPPLELQAVIDESALHRGSSEPDMMSRQLRKLLADAEVGNVQIQVFPFASGFTPALSAFTIVEPRDSADAIVVNVESALQDSYFESADDVARYYTVWADLSSRSLSAGDSSQLIAELADAT